MIKLLFEVSYPVCSIAIVFNSAQYFDMQKIKYVCTWNRIINMKIMINNYVNYLIGVNPSHIAEDGRPELVSSTLDRSSLISPPIQNRHGNHVLPSAVGTRVRHRRSVT
jgi:hypothetical protein